MVKYDGNDFAFVPSPNGRSRLQVVFEGHITSSIGPGQAKMIKILDCLPISPDGRILDCGIHGVGYGSPSH